MMQMGSDEIENPISGTSERDNHQPPCSAQKGKRKSHLPRSFGKNTKKKQVIRSNSITATEGIEVERGV